MATLVITMENKGRKESSTDAVVLPRGTCSSVKDVRQKGSNVHRYEIVL